MNEKTSSEVLLERFCSENGLSFLRIPCASVEGVKTPDYEITINHRRFIAEVKQLDPCSPNDMKYQEQLDEKGITDAHENKVAQRIRKKISDAMPQLKKGMDEKTPGLLFLYSNLPMDGYYIHPRFILEAMYGVEIFDINLPNDGIAPYISNIRFGGKRKVTTKHNTSLSAIVTLFEDREHHEIHAYFYHNIYSKCKFNPEWFRHKRVKHFSPSSEDTVHFLEWDEV